MKYGQPGPDSKVTKTHPVQTSFKHKSHESALKNAFVKNHLRFTIWRHDANWFV